MADETPADDAPGAGADETPAAGGAPGGDLPEMDAGDIESLVGEANEKAGVTEEQSRPVETAEPPRGSDETEELLAQAEQDLEKAISGDLDDDDVSAEMADAKPFEFNDLASSGGGSGPLPISALQDVELDLRIELGRTELLIDDVMKLAEGSVVQLDKLAGDPVDVLVNGRLIARGEVLVLNDNFCVRVAEILTPEE